MAITVHVDSSTFKTTVQFALDCDAPAGEVSVVGSFNGWCAGVDPLAPQDDGTRSVTVTVPFGQDVHFRYLADSARASYYHADAPQATPTSSAPATAGP